MLSHKQYFLNFNCLKTHLNKELNTVGLQRHIWFELSFGSFLIEMKTRFNIYFFSPPRWISKTLSSSTQVFPQYLSNCRTHCGPPDRKFWNLHGKKQIGQLVFDFSCGCPETRTGKKTKKKRET